MEKAGIDCLCLKSAAVLRWRVQRHGRSKTGVDVIRQIFIFVQDISCRVLLDFLAELARKCLCRKCGHCVVELVMSTRGS